MIIAAKEFSFVYINSIQFQRINLDNGLKTIFFCVNSRLYIAALHFNENGNRQQRSTQDGTPMYSVSFPKSRKGEGIAKEIKVQQTYGKCCFYCIWTKQANWVCQLDMLYIHYIYAYIIYIQTTWTTIWKN